MRINKRSKILLFVIVLLIGVFIFFIFLFSFQTVNPLPEKYLGNWINENNNNWEYGLFEDFAIYKSDFWEYQSIKQNDTNCITLTLTRKKEKIKLQLLSYGEKQIVVKHKDGKENLFVRMEKRYPAYPVKDTTSFSNPLFLIDSVTVIGYYRNMDKGMKGFVERFFPSPFEVAVYDFLTGEQVKYYTDIDPSGRFKLTLPIINSQELLVDWKRTRIRAVVEPQDTLFLFADINDYLMTANDRINYESYIDRPKQVLFMGNNARLNNEIYQYKNPWIQINKSELKGLDNMQYLIECKNAYNKRITLLNEHIEKNPTVSEKFKIYQFTKEKYELGFNLLQHYYDITPNGNNTFHEDYIRYIKENFSLTNELDYTLTGEFFVFIRDYIYYTRQQQGPFLVFFEEIGERLKADGKLTDDIQLQIDEINKLVIASDNTNEKEKLAEEIRVRADKLNANELVKKIAGILHTEKKFLNTTFSDSLITNQNLRELWTTYLYYKWFDVLRKPLSVQQQNIFNQKVKNPDLRNYINNIQQHYGKVANNAIVYEASLKSTEHLKECKEADSLFEALIQPYKGKVIYVDFWGTWCGGCRRDMKIIGNIKKELENEEVIFMYFANRSPEDTWKNVIKEMNLTGKNIVHFRLPAEQQGMIERKFSINHFPTYMLIDKRGKVVNTNAQSPTDSEGIIRQIKELL